MIDQRTYPRVRVKVPLCIALGSDKLIGPTSHDLSGGGMSFDAGWDIPLGPTSRLVVSRLGDLPQAASIDSRVRRREWNTLVGRFVVGVEFMSFVGMTRDELLEAIRRWEAPALA